MQIGPGPASSLIRPRQPNQRQSNQSRWLLQVCLVGCLCVSFCTAQQAIVLVGSGSSVPGPLYAKWAEEYNKHTPKIQMRYLPLGTSEGIRQIVRGSGDFAAGETPLTANEQGSGKLVELPTALIAIVPIYNVPGIQREVRFSGEVLAEIFLGHIKTWDSPIIAKVNPQLSLPNLPIKVIYRPAGKGSNYVFSEFLSKTSAKFRAEIGTSSSPKWPVGVSAERSADMAEKVKSDPGSIGFVEYQYAVKEQIPYGSVLNRAGHFVKPSAATISAACKSVEAPGWDKFSASLIDTADPDSFPITSFTWLYLPTGSHDPARASAVADLLNWMFSEGQAIAVQEGYSSLPPPLLEKVNGRVRSLR